MAIVGTIETDIRGGETYAEGGIGPLFRKTMVSGPFTLTDLLTRTCKAFERVGDMATVSLFLDETEVYGGGDEDEDVSLDDVLRLGHDEAATLEATSFHLMLSHEDADFSHVFSVEASTEHELEEPALTVLDTVEVLAGEEDVDGPDEREDEAVEADDVVPGLEIDEEEYVPRLERFLERLMRELDRELALEDPEIEVWVDYEGRFEGLRRYSEALAGVSGYTGETEVER